MFISYMLKVKDQNNGLEIPTENKVKKELKKIENIKNGECDFLDKIPF